MSSILWYPGHEHLLGDIVRGEGGYVYDARGKRYLDLESGVWAASLGHGHPRILAALAEQAARITHNGFCWSSPVVEEAALDLLSLLGFDGGKCVFLSSGSDAVEYGVRVARMLADRPLFLTMTDSYFGAYGSAAARGAEEWTEFDWFPCAEEAHACGEACARLATVPFDRIGGFLLEPGSSSGLVRFPPAKLIREIARRVRDAGGWLIVNEVTTGIGRTGAWFGFQHYGITPDVVAMGKGVGGTYPVSATAFSRRAAERLGDRQIKYAQSHQNDPLGAAVLRAVIRTIREDGLIEHAARMGQILGEGLEAIRSRQPRLRMVRIRGLMAAVDLEDGPDCSFTIRIHHDLISRGFIVGRRPGINVLRIDPSLTIERADLEAFLAAFEEALLAG